MGTPQKGLRRANATTDALRWSDFYSYPRTIAPVEPGETVPAPSDTTRCRGASPLLTEHWMTRSRLILRQGWYFRAVIPFSDIESIVRSEEASRTRVPLGIHRPLGQPALFVTGGRTNLISVRLRRPRKFWQAFGLTATEIIFDVDDPEGFLRAFEERRTSLPPVQAHSAGAEL